MHHVMIYVMYVHVLYIHTHENNIYTCNQSSPLTMYGTEYICTYVVRSQGRHSFFEPNKILYVKLVRSKVGGPNFFLFRRLIMSAF